MELTISTRFVDDVVVLDLNGRITFGEPSAALRDSVKRMVAEGKRKILLNIAGIQYIDSSGFGTLANASIRAEGQGGRLKLCGATGKARDALQVAKFNTFIDVFNDESTALESFASPDLHCCCPLCGHHCGPSVVSGGWISWPPQVCRNTRCEATLSLYGSRDEGQVRVKSVRIQTYKDEYFEVLTGPPYIIRIVGRLNLFSSAALKKSWQACPGPRRVVFDLGDVTEVDEAGRKALLGLLASCEESARAVVSLKGLSSDQVGSFPAGPPFYLDWTAASAALGDVSDTPPLQVRVLKE